MPSWKLIAYVLDWAAPRPVDLCPHTQHRWREPLHIGHCARVQIEPVPVLLERQRRQRVALGLAWVTIAWNTVEAVVAIGAGAVASSIALVSFGLDSTVEVLSASVIVWQMTHDVPEDREARALRLVAVKALRTCRVCDGASGVRPAHRKQAALKHGRNRAGRRVACRDAGACMDEASQRTTPPAPTASLPTVSRRCCAPICRRGSSLGLVLNATVGWWWADPLATLVIAALAFNGAARRRGEHCCDDDDCAA